MSPTKKKTNKTKAKGRRFMRKHFEALVIKNKMLLSDLVDLHNKGILGDNDYVFTFDGVVDIAYATAKGFHANCRQLDNHKSRWARDIGTEDARLFIKKAFT